MSKKSKIAPVSVQKPVISSSPLLDRFEKQTIWHIVILVLLPFFVYIKTSGFEFINFDDTAIITNNFNVLSNIHNIGLSFKTDAFITLHGDYYRPLQTVTFFIDTFLGSGRPIVFHITNLLLHLLTVLSLYFLLRSLKIKNLTALFGALLFSIHPLLASSVSWVPSRGDLLLGLFGVLLFTCFDRYFNTGKKIYLFLHLLLFSLAIFSKETALVFPVLLLMHYFLVLKEKFSIKKLAPFFIIWIAPLVLFYILRSKVVIGTPPAFIFGITPFMQNLPAIPIVFAKMLIPASLSTMPLFDSTFTTIGVVLLIAAFILVIRFCIKKQWLPAIGLAWFLFFMIPPMFFKLFYSKYLLEYYEHRAYLPAMGFIIMVMYLLNEKIFRAKNAILNLLPVAVLILFTFLASVHSDDFKESIAFFTRATDLGNPGACTKRGEMYYEQHDFQDAQNDYNKAIDLSDNKYPPAFYDRGKLNSDAVKDHKAAEQDYNTTIMLDSNYIEAYVQRSNERIINQDISGAFSDAFKAKQLDSTYAGAYNALGNVYVHTSDFKNALVNFTRSIQLDSFSADIFNNRAYVLYRLKEYQQALSDCQHATDLVPQFLNAYYNKGLIYLELDKPAVAEKELDTTLALADNFYFGYFYRGMAKKQLNDMKGACADWQKSVDLGFTMAQDTINKYCK